MPEFSSRDKKQGRNDPQPDVSLQLNRLFTDDSQDSPPLLPLLESLISSRPDSADSISEALAKLGPRILPALLEVSESVNYQVRSCAVKAICKMNNPSQEISEGLIDLARKESHQHRALALSVIGINGTNSKEELDILMSSLESDDRSTRQMAAQAIGDLRGYVPYYETLALCRMLQEENSEIAALALEKTGAENDEITSLLARFMADKSKAEGLRSTCGKAACELIKKDNPKVETYAVQTLKQLRDSIDAYQERESEPPLRSIFSAKNLLRLPGRLLRRFLSHATGIDALNFINPLSEPPIIFRHHHHYAIVALCKMSSPSRQGIEALLDLIDFGPHSCCHGVLGAIKEGAAHSSWLAPELSKYVLSKSRTRRYAALNALSAVGKHAESAGPALLKLVKKDPLSRTSALLILSQLDKYKKEVLKFVDSDLRNSEYCSGIIENLGESAAPLEPLLIQLLEDPEFANKSGILQAASEMTNPGEQLLTVITALAANRSFRTDCVKTLAALGRPLQAANKVLPLVMDDLRSTDPLIRQPAMDLISEFGPYAKETVPRLMELARAGDQQACLTLCTIGSTAKEVVPILAERINRDLDTVDFEEIEALGLLGPAAAGSLSALMNVLEYDGHNSLFEGDIKLSCIKTLGAIGPAARDALPLILKYSELAFCRSELHDLTVISALEQIGSLTDAVRDRLMKWLQNGGERIRKRAIQALVNLSASQVFTDRSPEAVDKSSATLAAIEEVRQQTAATLMVEDNIRLVRTFDTELLQILVRMSAAEFCRDDEAEQLQKKVDQYQKAQVEGKIAPLVPGFRPAAASLRPGVTVRDLTLSKASEHTLHRLGEMLLNNRSLKDPETNDFRQCQAALIENLSKSAEKFPASETVLRSIGSAKNTTDLLAVLLRTPYKKWPKRLISELKKGLRELAVFNPLTVNTSSSRFPVIIDDNAGIKERLDAASGFFRNTIEPAVEKLLHQSGASPKEVENGKKLFALALGIKGVEQELQVVVKHESKLEMLHDPEAQIGLIFKPSRGLLAELSGYICDTCWLIEDGITEKHPKLVFIAFILQPKVTLPGAANTPLVGGSLLLPTSSRDGEPIMVVRGLNPHDDLLKDVSVGSLCENFFDYLASISHAAGMHAVVIPDDICCGRTQTNRPQINGYIKNNYGKAPTIMLPINDETVFYNRELGRCLVVRDRSQILAAPLIKT
jgi:hypothetical protein